MTLATDLTAVGSTIDLAKANLAKLSTTFNSEIAARDATIAQLQAQIAQGGSTGPVITPPPTPTLTLTSSLVTVSGTQYARITAMWNVDAIHLTRDGNDAFNSGAYTANLTAGQRTATFDFCLSNTHYNVTLTLASGAVATNSTTTPTYVAPPPAGTVTFTGADGSALPSPWQSMSNAGVPSALTPNNIAQIEGNALTQTVTHVSGDQYTRSWVPCTFSNLRASGRLLDTDLGVHSESCLMRHNGTYESNNSTSYIVEIRPKEGTVGFGRRVLVGGVSTYGELEFVPFTFTSHADYYFRYEVQDTTLRLYFGAVAFSGAWTVTYTDNAADALYGLGAIIEFWNGDHSLSAAGTHKVKWDDILIEDLGGVAVAPVPGGGTGGAPLPGRHLLGVFAGNSAGDPAYFGGLVNHEVKVYGASCVAAFGLPSLFTSGGVTAWLKGDSTRRLVLDSNILIDEPGNFESQAASDAMVLLAHGIVGQGIASQVIIRMGYEMNGDWMPWGRQFPGNNDGTRFKAMWLRIHHDVNLVFPFQWDWCFNFWDSDDAYTRGALDHDWFYPGDDVVDFVGSDNYDVLVYGDANARWQQVGARMQNQVTFCARHGKVPTQDEWAVWTTANSAGGGDDPTYVTNHLQFQKDNGYGWGIYFNTKLGEVETLLQDNPDSVTAFRAHVWN